MSASETYYRRSQAAIAALRRFYNRSTGLWHTTGWWNAANALETLIDYCAIASTLTPVDSISNTFNRHKHRKFLNQFYDDEGWWALTWIKAYDLTGEFCYLNMAKTLFSDMITGWDSVCGGGLWWTKERNYKNAITNELFLAIAARLHLRIPEGEASRYYLDWAQREWSWFSASGLINAENLINDGLDNACQNNGQTTWTYNQGVILGALVDLYKSTKDISLLHQAEAIADAAIAALAPNGILQEPCEPDCGADGPQFKGIFIRNLRYLCEVINKPAYRSFIFNNADTIWCQCRNSVNQFGLSWAGPFSGTDAARQSSAIDALNAALFLSNWRS